MCVRVCACMGVCVRAHERVQVVWTRTLQRRRYQQRPLCVNKATAFGAPTSRIWHGELCRLRRSSCSCCSCCCALRMCSGVMRQRRSPNQPASQNQTMSAWSLRQRACGFRYESNARRRNVLEDEATVDDNVDDDDDDGDDADEYQTNIKGIAYASVACREYKLKINMATNSVHISHRRGARFTFWWGSLYCNHHSRNVPAWTLCWCSSLRCRLTLQPEVSATISFTLHMPCVCDLRAHYIRRVINSPASPVSTAHN